MKKDILKSFALKGSNISIGLSQLYVPKAKTEVITGNNRFGSKSDFGKKIDITYQRHLNINYSLSIGAEIKSIGRNFTLDVDQNEFSPQLIQNYKFDRTNTSTKDWVISIPIIVQKRLVVRNKSYLFLSGGCGINFSLGADFDLFVLPVKDINNSIFNIGLLDVNANNDAKPWVTIPLSFGNSWLLKNNNFFQVSLSGNFSFTKYLRGDYTIDIPNQGLANGRYTSSGTYACLSMNYVFTNANYRIRKEYERKL